MVFSLGDYGNYKQVVIQPSFLCNVFSCNYKEMLDSNGKHIGMKCRRCGQEVRTWSFKIVIKKETNENIFS